MKRVCLMMLAMMMTMAMVRADEQITVAATSKNIADNLDLKVVAKLFAEAKNLEEFESMLNNPDSSFCNLDLNGDGQIDYLRVIETGEGNNRLIILQAVLAKDIYQDVASIYVEKDDAGNVTVQVIGNEKVYGREIVIEPVYVYRPYIYDWFWSPYWTAWYSPYCWGYWPGWWYHRPLMDYHFYHHHCHHYCYDHFTCSFQQTRHIRPSARVMQDRVRTSERSAPTNRANVDTYRSAARSASSTSRQSAPARTYGSSNIATRSAGARSANSTSAARSAGRVSETRSVNSGSTRAASSTSRSASSARSASVYNSGATRSSSSSSANAVRSSSSYSGSNARSVSSYSGGGARSASSFSGGGARSAGSYSGGGGGGARSAVRR